MLQKIRKEYQILRTEYDREFEAIEDAFAEERTRIIHDHTKEIDSLFETRKVKEAYYKESKQAREEACQREVDDLIAKGVDQHTKLKITLELNIQTLNEQLEEIRATYQLNTEKLDYNYRVLTDLDVEKHAELTKYKKRLSKLKDQLSGFVSKYTELETSETKVNDDLTEDYRRLTRKYKELQAKFRHFEISDTQKFEEVWGMHEDEAKNKVDQLLKADKIITEQQLHWAWKAPDMAALQNVLSKRGAIVESVVAADPATGEDTRTVSGAKMRAIVRLIASEAGFLLNQEVQAAIESLPEEEAELSKAENLLKALGVKSEDKLKTLVSYFFHDKSGSTTQENQAEFEMEIQTLHNAPNDIHELRDLIRAEDVIQAVAMFIEDTSDTNLGGATTAAGKDPLGGKRKQEALKRYWDQLANIVSDESVNVWIQLEKDCQNLKEVLSKRAALVENVDTLAAKNAELKITLNRYLGDPVNQYFQIPPGQTIRVRANLGKPFKENKGTTGKGPTMSTEANVRRLMSQTK